MCTINLGGLVSLSTVDWTGLASCVVFFRGCSAQCWYCHNKEICTGEDIRDIHEIEKFIRSASFMISGVVFSGGECTEQPDALYKLCRVSRSIGLKTSIHTNGLQPDVIQYLIRKNLIDHISLDIKTAPLRYEWLTQVVDSEELIRESMKICFNARNKIDIECITTMVPDMQQWLSSIRACIPEDVKWVLQQSRVASKVYPVGMLLELGEQYHTYIRSGETGEISPEQISNLPHKIPGLPVLEQ